MTSEETAALKAALQEHRPKPGEQANILRTLLAVQQSLGHIPVGAVGQIAETLRVPEAHVAGVLSYYPDLHMAPRGRRVVRICLGEACVANRATDLLTNLQRIFGIGLGETTEDGRTTLERVYCLGNCGVGPTVMVDETIYGRVSASDLHEMMKRTAP